MQRPPPSKGIPVKRALLVIDVQNEYFTGRLPLTHPPGSLDKVLRAMDEATRRRIPVAVIQHAALSPNSPVFRQGSAEWELHPEVARRHRDTLIAKNWPDSFHDTALGDWLRQQGADTVAICGYMTQMCCDTTARRAFHLGYGVEFVTDATATLPLEGAAGKVSAEELYRSVVAVQARFGSVLTTEDWIRRLEAAA
jgi:nicotinamidase-related amidase